MTALNVLMLILVITLGYRVFVLTRRARRRKNVYKALKGFRELREHTRKVRG